VTLYIVFLRGTFGNSEGDVVPVEESDSENVYYTDGFDRWCYMERTSPDIAIIEAADRRQANRMAKKMLTKREMA
jgi:hypothetical protein